MNNAKKLIALALSLCLLLCAIPVASLLVSANSATNTAFDDFVYMNDFDNATAESIAADFDVYRQDAASTMVDNLVLTDGTLNKNNFDFAGSNQNWPAINNVSFNLKNKVLADFHLTVDMVNTAGDGTDYIHFGTAGTTVRQSGFCVATEWKGGVTKFFLGTAADANRDLTWHLVRIEGSAAEYTTVADADLGADVPFTMDLTYVDGVATLNVYKVSDPTTILATLTKNFGEMEGTISLVRGGVSRTAGFDNLVITAADPAYTTYYNNFNNKTADQIAADFNVYRQDAASTIADDLDISAGSLNKQNVDFTAISGNNNWPANNNVSFNLKNKVYSDFHLTVDMQSTGGDGTDYIHFGTAGTTVRGSGFAVATEWKGGVTKFWLGTAAEATKDLTWHLVRAGEQGSQAQYTTVADADLGGSVPFTMDLTYVNGVATLKVYKTNDPAKTVLAEISKDFGKMEGTISLVRGATCRTAGFDNLTITGTEPNPPVHESGDGFYKNDFNRLTAADVTADFDIYKQSGATMTKVDEADEVNSIRVDQGILNKPNGFNWDSADAAWGKNNRAYYTLNQELGDFKLTFEYFDNQNDGCDFIHFGPKGESINDSGWTLAMNYRGSAGDNFWLGDKDDAVSDLQWFYLECKPSFGSTAEFINIADDLIVNDGSKSVTIEITHTNGTVTVKVWHTEDPDKNLLVDFTNTFADKVGYISFVRGHVWNDSMNGFDNIDLTYAPNVALGVEGGYLTTTASSITDITEIGYMINDVEVSNANIYAAAMGKLSFVATADGIYDVDVNNDNIADAADIAALKKNILKDEAAIDADAADLVDDDKISVKDLVRIEKLFAESCVDAVDGKYVLANAMPSQFADATEEVTVTPFYKTANGTVKGLPVAVQLTAGVPSIVE